MNVSEFLHYYNSSPSLNFITNINSLKRGSKGTYKDGSQKALSTLLSFNIASDKILNFKLYCELFRDDFSDADILKFVPVITEFKKYVKWWDKNKPSSLCFGIKIDQDLIETKYTYLKLRYQDVEKKFRNNKLGLPYQSDFVGIAFEYTLGNVVEKKYWYYSESNDVAIIIEKFGLQNTVLKHPIYHIEYTEFGDGRSKIIIVYDYYNTSAFNEKFLGDMIKKDFSGKTSDVVKFMENQFLLDPRYIGVYDKKVIAVYWSLTGKTLDDYRIRSNINSYNI